MAVLDHPRGGFTARIEYPDNTPVFCPQGREAIAPIGFFLEPEAAHGQQLILNKQAFAAFYLFCELGLDDVPDIVPDILGAGTKRFWVPRPGDRCPGVIVQQPKFRAPVNCRRKGGIQTDRKRRTK